MSGLGGPRIPGYPKWLGNLAFRLFLATRRGVPGLLLLFLGLGGTEGRRTRRGKDRRTRGFIGFLGWAN